MDHAPHLSGKCTFRMAKYSEGYWFANYCAILFVLNSHGTLRSVCLPKNKWQLIFFKKSSQAKFLTSKLISFVSRKNLAYLLLKTDRHLKAIFAIWVCPHSSSGVNLSLSSFTCTINYLLVLKCCIKISHFVFRWEWNVRRWHGYNNGSFKLLLFTWCIVDITCFC